MGLMKKLYGRECAICHTNYIRCERCRVVECDCRPCECSMVDPDPKALAAMERYDRAMERMELNVDTNPEENE